LDKLVGSEIVFLFEFVFKVKFVMSCSFDLIGKMEVPDVTGLYDLALGSGSMTSPSTVVVSG